jgi:hypothetical protein
MAFTASVSSLIPTVILEAVCPVWHGVVGHCTKLWDTYDSTVMKQLSDYEGMFKWVYTFLHSHPSLYSFLQQSTRGFEGRKGVCAGALHC